MGISAPTCRNKRLFNFSNFSLCRSVVSNICAKLVCLAGRYDHEALGILTGVGYDASLGEVARFTPQDKLQRVHKRCQVVLACWSNVIERI